MKKSKWKKNMPELDEPILAVVETNSGPEYFIGKIDERETLIDLDYGDDSGWQFESVDRWCPLETVLSIINGDET